MIRSRRRLSDFYQQAMAETINALHEGRQRRRRAPPAPSHSVPAAAAAADPSAESNVPDDEANFYNFGDEDYEDDYFNAGMFDDDGGEADYYGDAAGLSGGWPRTMQVSGQNRPFYIYPGEFLRFLTSHPEFFTDRNQDVIDLYKVLKFLRDKYVESNFDFVPFLPQEARARNAR